MIGGMFLIFVLFLALGIPIAFSVGWATLSVHIMDPTFACNAEYFFKTMVNGMDSYVLLAIPLFMLSSSIMAESGMSNRLFDFFSYFFGNIPAGLPIAVVVTCLFYGAICGSGPATVAAIGTMCIPLLTRLGYDRDFVTSMIAVSGGLGVIIPPSIPFITTPSRMSIRGCPSSVAAMEIRFCRSGFSVLPISTHSSPASGFTPPHSLTGTSTPPAITAADLLFEKGTIVLGNELS